MQAILVESELYERVEQASQEEKQTIIELCAEAIRRYLWELDRKQISKESQRYREQHATLKGLYLGQYIAMRHGQVIDSDADARILRQRVRGQLGRKPVMITLVQETTETPLVHHSFRMETSHP